jgi:uncharacterized protein
MSQEEAAAPAEDAAEAIKSRLRPDLRTAMVARDALRVRVLRALIAAVDDAQAVPAGDRHARYIIHAFGDRSVEVPRLSLAEEDVRRLFAHEAATRRSAAAEMRRLAQDDRAEDLLREAAIIASYC